MGWKSIEALRFQLGRVNCTSANDTIATPFMVPNVSIIRFIHNSWMRAKGTSSDDMTNTKFMESVMTFTFNQNWMIFACCKNFIHPIVNWMKLSSITTMLNSLLHLLCLDARAKTNIRFSDRWCVISTITCHGNDLIHFP